MNRIEKAIQIALMAHSGQVDKGGSPYILHPLRIASKFKSESEIIVSILHDVIEDTDITLEQLQEEVGLKEEESNAIKCLTRSNKETYFNYIERISKDNLARKVKIEDIKDNLDESRLPDEKHSPSLKRRYEKALNILENKIRE